MKIIKRMVAAIDFSNYSSQILEYAAAIGERTPAELIAVNVINKRLFEYMKKEFEDDDLGKFSLEKYIQDEEKKRRLNLENLIKQCVSKQVNTRIIIRSGVPYEEILKVVEDETADILVIGSRGRTNFSDYMFGTTAEKIFRHSPVSILSLNLTIMQ